MNYNELEKNLLQIFENKHFVNHFEEYLKTNQKNKLNSQSEIVNSQLNLKINFPGYKTKKKYNHYTKKNKITYDYRVDLNEIAISHTNIVVDIYNKSIQNPEIRIPLYNFLVDISKNALNTNLNNHQLLLNFKFTAPTPELLNQAAIAHQINRKIYNKNANKLNYSLEQLKYLISYIVLQEDINYPMPKKAGRRMSFYRYIEAIICSSTRNNYSLSDVITRSLSHNFPPLWEKYLSYYRPVFNLANQR